MILTRCKAVLQPRQWIVDQTNCPVTFCDLGTMENPSEHASLNLGNIQTQWSLIRQAHQASMVGQSASAARQALVMRYATAIRRFVQLIVKSPEKADELAQDAMVRLLQGDFAGADPKRGRFRDLLKTAIRNMARNDWAKESRRTGVDFDLGLLGDDNADASEQWETQWVARWRESLMGNVWEQLKAWEKTQAGSVSYTLLKLRADFPDDSSTELAERLSKQIGRTIKPEATRQQLRRARVRFVEFLVTEIANGLQDADPDSIKQELMDLGLFASVKDVLPLEFQS